MSALIAPITLLDGAALRLDEVLHEGDQVKLDFLAGRVCERMWVRVLDQEPWGSCYGVLIDAPLFLKNIDYGDEVYFEPRHVVVIVRAGEVA